MSNSDSVVGGLGMVPYFILGAYLAVLLLLGWVGYRRSSAGEEDYYLAGRQQTWIVSSLSIMSTFFSSFALLGAPGMVYREGVVFALFSLNVPLAGLAIYLLGVRIWRVGRVKGYVTPADKLNGLAAEIHAERDRKLEEARARRQAARATAKVA